MQNVYTYITCGSANVLHAGRKILLPVVSHHFQKPESPTHTLPLRTLEGIKNDHSRYVAAGSDIRKAKSFNNAIHAPLLNVDLDQVRMYVALSRIWDKVITYF